MKLLSGKNSTREIILETIKAQSRVTVDALALGHGDLRAAGEDANKILPGWNSRFIIEQRQLVTLASSASSFEAQKKFKVLEERLAKGWVHAISQRPTEMSFLEKANALAKGGISALTDPIIEAGKQAVDVGKILAFAGYRFAGGEGWEPELYSDLANVADKEGAGTWDLVIGMGEAIVDTPERVYEAIKNDDWEAIGREAVNLYLLGKAARSGVSGAKQIPARLRQAAGQATAVIRLLRSKMLATGRFGGMSKAAIQAVQQIAKTHGLEIVIRPVENVVIRLRELGHPGKIAQLKMKTIKQIDTYLGAGADDIGKVGFFEPVMPENILQLPKKTSIAVSERYMARMHEWRSMKGTVKQLTAEGVAELRGKVIVDPVSGKAFTGDYDLFEIRKGGQNLNYDTLETQIREALQQEPIATRHGDHLSWDNIEAGQAEIFAKIVREHRPGGEALMKFGPDGLVSKSTFDD